MRRRRRSVAARADSPPNVVGGANLPPALGPLPVVTFSNKAATGTAYAALANDYPSSYQASVAGQGSGGDEPDNKITGPIWQF